jgi:hypothetical protein
LPRKCEDFCKPNGKTGNYQLRAVSGSNQYSNYERKEYLLF